MSKYRAIYKCRLCGEKFEKVKVGHKRAVAGIICLGSNGDRLFGDPTTDIVIYRALGHKCKDGSLGFADFIGFRKVEDKDENSN